MAWKHVKLVLDNDNLRRTALRRTVPVIVATGLLIFAAQAWSARVSGMSPEYWLAPVVVAIGLPMRLNVVATEMLSPGARRRHRIFLVYICVFLLLSFIAIWFFL